MNTTHQIQFKQKNLNDYTRKQERILAEFQNIFQVFKYILNRLLVFSESIWNWHKSRWFFHFQYNYDPKSICRIRIIEMQEDQALHLKYKSTSITEFWKFIPESKYFELKKAACWIISVFVTTYVHESFYSTLKFVKSKHRSILTNKHLKELLRSAVTNYSPNFKNHQEK